MHQVVKSRHSPLLYASPPKRVVRTKASSSSEVTSPTATSIIITELPQWSSFCSAVSGEWEGAHTTLDPTGQPLELPTLYVPQAYRDYGVTLYDWQSQCSSLGYPSKGQVKMSLKKLMPTVGCEADAVAFQEEKLDMFSTDYPPLFVADGSYIRAPATTMTTKRQEGGVGSSTIKIEHCFTTGEKAERKRLRLVQTVSSLERDATIRSLELGLEEWSEPYNGGTELFACGGGSRKPSQAPRCTEQDVLGGEWRTNSSDSSLSGGGMRWHMEGMTPIAQPLRAGETIVASSSLTGTVTMLPSQCWSRIVLIEANGVRFEAGWIEGGGKRRVSSVTYQGGNLVGGVLGEEVKV